MPTMASGRLVAVAVSLTPRHTHPSAKVIQRPKSLSTAPSSNRSKVAKQNVTITSENCEHILILGAGIAGLSTARYLLQHTQQQNIRAKITIIDRNIDILPTINTLPSLHSPHHARLHKNIPSRRNGNVLCPSLTVPWTTRSLWNEAILPGLKTIISSREPTPSISFDWPSLMSDKDMVRPML